MALDVGTRFVLMTTMVMILAMDQAALAADQAVGPEAPAVDRAVGPEAPAADLDQVAADQAVGPEALAADPDQVAADQAVGPEALAADPDQVAADQAVALVETTTTLDLIPQMAAKGSEVENRQEGGKCHQLWSRKFCVVCPDKVMIVSLCLALTCASLTRR